MDGAMNLCKLACRQGICERTYSPTGRIEMKRSGIEIGMTSYGQECGDDEDEI